MFGRRNIINKKKQINRTSNLAVKRLQKNKPWIVFCKKQLSLTKGILLNQKMLLTVLSLPAISLILFGIIKISESDIARIQNIDVIGTQIIDSHDIIKISNLNGQSIFSTNLNQARQNIANINGIEKVTISRKNVNGIEIIISVIFITIVGGLSLSFLGKRILKLIDDLFKRIPVLRTIYSAIVQMTEPFSNKDDNSKKSVVGIVLFFSV